LPIADPGISFNPDPQAQQALMRKAYEQHLEEKKEQTNLSKRFNPKPGEEMKDTEAEDPVQEGEERPLKTRVISVKRLTQAQRNKKRRKIHLSEELKRKKAQKNLKQQIKKLPQVLKDIQDAESAKKNGKRDDRRVKEKP